MTLESVIESYHLDKNEVYRFLGLPAGEKADQAMKDLGQKYGFETEKIREYVAEKQ